MTVYEFIDMCSQDWIDIDLFDCGTGNCITVNIENAWELDDIMKAEALSWDIGDNGRICINYERGNDD